MCALKNHRRMLSMVFTTAERAERICIPKTSSISKVHPFDAVIGSVSEVFLDANGVKPNASSYDNVYSKKKCFISINCYKIEHWNAEDPRSSNPVAIKHVDCRYGDDSLVYLVKICYLGKTISALQFLFDYNSFGFYSTSTISFKDIL